ncbi:MAG: DUF2461 domain-containing protein [Alphaproteobacteria bacterium]|nr:DUF2461 domain-containing protein [Alphaproteobacteria bacterium]
MAIGDFSGFDDRTFAFLIGLSAHNDKAWFEAHRDAYEAHYVGAAKSFVQTVGPRLADISPGVRFEARINGSISRINRDVRFSKDKRPYKDHLDLWFWHGDKRGWDSPGFFLRLTAETLILGAGMLVFPRDMLGRYRTLVSDPDAAADIRAVLDAVAASGPYRIGDKARKQVPRGLPAMGASGDMLLYDGLGATLEWDNGVARDRGFVDFCLGHWRKCWPVGKWTLDRIWR